MAETNLVVGAGKVYFDLFAPNTLVGTGERYFGNTPAFTLTTNATTLEHFSSDTATRDKDRSLVLSNDVGGSVQTDDISPDNVSLFFGGSTGSLTVSSAPTLTETITMRPGRRYQLGTSDSEPSGKRKLTLTSAAIGGTPLVVNTDYVFDGETGGISITPTSTAVTASGAQVLVTYAQVAYSRTQTIAKGQATKGALRFIADNTEGANADHYMPYVQLTSNGDYSLKGQDFSAMSFNIEVLKRSDRFKLYIDGRGVV